MHPAADYKVYFITKKLHRNCVYDIIFLRYCINIYVIIGVKALKLADVKHRNYFE
jgi:hypothetical protein